MAYAERARHINLLVSRVNQFRFAFEICDVDSDEIASTIDEMNSILLPHACVGIDSEFLFHVTWLLRRPEGVSSLLHCADFAWVYDPVTSTLRCIKDRSGNFQDKVFTSGCKAGPVVGTLGS